jgi:hypothetical protein
MADTRTMFELIDAYAKADARSTERDARAEIVRRLALIERYGGTEASNIKAILRYGQPLDYEAERAARRKLGDRAPQG